MLSLKQDRDTHTISDLLESNGKPGGHSGISMFEKEVQEEMEEQEMN